MQESSEGVVTGDPHPHLLHTHTDTAPEPHTNRRNSCNSPSVQTIVRYR